MNNVSKFDISTFQKFNVADSCSIWNLLASRLLYSAAASAGIKLCCTTFAEYECLHKRGQVRPERTELQARLKRRLGDTTISSYPIDLEDLQSVEVLRNRKKVSLGELSTIVFAQKTQQAILTDDKAAQKLAREVLLPGHVQCTPHLFAWLYFNSLLSDGDKDHIIGELKALERHLDPHMDTFYVEAQRYKAIALKGANLV